MITDHELTEMYERSKLDTEMWVGSDIRVLIQAVREAREENTRIMNTFNHIVDMRIRDALAPYLKTAREVLDAST